VNNFKFNLEECYLEKKEREQKKLMIVKKFHLQKKVLSKKVL